MFHLDPLEQITQEEINQAMIDLTTGFYFIFICSIILTIFFLKKKNARMIFQQILKSKANLIRSLQLIIQFKAHKFQQYLFYFT